MFVVAAAWLALPSNGAAEPGPAPQPHREASIIGGDDRHQVLDTTVLPYSAIALVEALDDNYELTELCTGALVGPDAVLTAAHCLWDPENERWARHVRVTPGKNGIAAPFGSAFATDWWVPDAFVDSGGDPDFDFGLLRLADGHLGQNAGWLTLTVLDDAQLADPAFTPAIAGYPADRPEDTMWAAEAARLATVDLFVLWYQVDTEAGESGAPIWSARPGSPLYGRVVGIHTHGSGGPGGLNSGARLDSEMLDDLVAACAEIHCTLEVAPPLASSTGPSGRPPYGVVGPQLARD